MNVCTNNIKMLSSVINGQSLISIARKAETSSDNIKDVIHLCIRRIGVLDNNKTIIENWYAYSVEELRYNREFWLKLIEKHKDSIDLQWTEGLDIQVIKSLLYNDIWSKNDLVTVLHKGIRLKRIGPITRMVLMEWINR